MEHPFFLQFLYDINLIALVLKLHMIFEFIANIVLGFTKLWYFIDQVTFILLGY